MIYKQSEENYNDQNMPPPLLTSQMTLKSQQRKGYLNIF